MGVDELKVDNLDEEWVLAKLTCFKDAPWGSPQSVLVIAEPSLDESGSCPFCHAEREKLWRFNREADKIHSFVTLGTFTMRQVLSLIGYW